MIYFLNLYSYLLVLFYLVDKKKTGQIFVEKFRNVVFSLHDDMPSSNVKFGLKYIQTFGRKDGMINFKEVLELHRLFPSILYPGICS